jgi:SIR2-like domain/NACHT domain
MLLEHIPATLLEAYWEKRLILFAGAGISVPSALPRATELAFEFQQELFKNRFVDTRPSLENVTSLELVAQRYQVAFGRQKLNDYLLRTFEKDGLLPNEAHKLATKLFSQIVTTNYDRLLEDALRQSRRAVTVVVRDLQLPNTAIPDRTTIYKLHGDIATPDRIVITQRDYARVPLDDGLRNELRSILLTKSVLFVGYGLGDSDFLRQLEFCRSLIGGDLHKSFAVIPGAEKDALFVKQCDQDNIDLFSDTAINFLGEFDEAVTKGPATPLFVHTKSAITPISEEQTEYRTTVSEDFKWILFTGIPVLGGDLRIPIDQLFVSLSATSHPGKKQEVVGSPKTKEAEKSRVGPTGLVPESHERKGIFEVISENPRLAILGDPGSGKTTLLRYIGYQLSLAEPDYESVGLEKPYLPIFVPLKQFASFLKANPHGTIATYLPELLSSHNLGKYLELVKNALNSGEAILLLDGLDEVASLDQRGRVAVQVQLFATTYRSCRLILTSRRVGYSDPPLEGEMGHFVVEGFTREQIHSFIDLWSKATGVEKEKQNLLDAIESPRVRVLGENPLLITILARVYLAYRNLPERRTELYSKCVEALLTTWDLVRDLPPVFQDAREANRVMGPLGLWIQKDCNGQLVTREQLIAKLAELGDLPRSQEPSVLLSQIEERSGLLRQVGFNQYAFTHLTFQEYYAAREIVSRGNWYGQLRAFLRNPRWFEVVKLTAGLLDDMGRFLRNRVLVCFCDQAIISDKT